MTVPLRTHTKNTCLQPFVVHLDKKLFHMNVNFFQPILIIKLNNIIHKQNKNFKGRFLYFKCQDLLLYKYLCVYVHLTEGPLELELQSDLPAVGDGKEARVLCISPPQRLAYKVGISPCVRWLFRTMKRKLFISIKA